MIYRQLKLIFGLLFSREKEACFFRWSFLLSIVYVSLPSIVRYVLHFLSYDYGKYPWIMVNVYILIKELLFALTTGSFLYLLFSLWQEKDQIKNKLTYAIKVYERMKIDILDAMICAQYDYVGPQKIINDTVERIFLNPNKAQEYFTYEVFKKVRFNLNNESRLFIIQKMQFFLDEFNWLSEKFIQDGDWSLAWILNDIREMKCRIEREQLSKDFGLGWCEEAVPKTTDPLYLLFCKDDNGNDPRYEKMLDTLEKYN